jgi:hypothetical protein
MAAGIIGRTRFTGDSMPRQKNAEAESDSGGTGRHRRKYFRRLLANYRYELVAVCDGRSRWR